MTTNDAGTEDSGATLEDAVEAVRGLMDQAIREENWDRLEELDLKARVLVERAFGEEPVPLRDDTGEALRSALERLSAFYEETVPILTERRGDASRQLRELRAGRKGTNAYENTRRNSMRSGPMKPGG
ncbi:MULTISPECIES: flagellar protein FliT [unclassified Thioalkalivibrio]|uniref:flagellar protein FliT n=1 Tax=unclassified Thioalkalivibrio TaxID=2621013 RepID=UPI000361D7F8|nr:MULTISPECIES: flagellar protein FliT [unclassified Thioalkalivibrio]